MMARRNGQHINLPQRLSFCLHSPRQTKTGFLGDNFFSFFISEPSLSTYKYKNVQSVDSIKIDNATPAVRDNEEAVTSNFCKICDFVSNKKEDLKAFICLKKMELGADTLVKYVHD